MKPEAQRGTAVTEGCKLKPGEECEWRGAVGVKPRKAAAPQTCAGCGKPFKKGEPWRFLRGKRLHVACIKQPEKNTLTL